MRNEDIIVCFIYVNVHIYTYMYIYVFRCSCLTSACNNLDTRTHIITYTNTWAPPCTQTHKHTNANKKCTCWKPALRKCVRRVATGKSTLLHYTRTSTRDTYAHTCISLSNAFVICIYAYTHAYIHMCIYMCMFVYNIYRYMYRYAYMYVLCLYTYIYRYSYIYMYEIAASVESMPT